MIKSEWKGLRCVKIVLDAMPIQFCEHVFFNVLNKSEEEQTTRQIVDVVGCSVQHGINMLKMLKEEGKIEGRQLPTRAFLWKRKK